MMTGLLSMIPKPLRMKTILSLLLQLPPRPHCWTWKSIQSSVCGLRWMNLIFPRKTQIHVSLRIQELAVNRLLCPCYGLASFGQIIFLRVWTTTNGCFSKRATFQIPTASEFSACILLWMLDELSLCGCS